MATLLAPGITEAQTDSPGPPSPPPPPAVDDGYAADVLPPASHTGWAYSGQPQPFLEPPQGAPLAWAPSLPTDLQTIPADWGNGTFGETSMTASGSYAATWPQPAGAWPTAEVEERGIQGVPPMVDPQQLYGAAGPWHGSWPAHDQQACAQAAATTPQYWPDDQQQYYMQQQQQYEQQGAPLYYAGAAGMYPPQQALLPAPAYAISPPQPAPRGRMGLARKKKAALPAEASFGCENLEGGGSVVLLHSAEASQAGLGDEPAAGTSRSGGRGSLDPSGLANHPSSAGAAGVQDATQASQQQQQQQQQAPLPSIEFDKAPRPVVFRPYSFADYRQRNFDNKQEGSKYWALGGLGPARAHSDAEWQAQQGKRDRQQQFGETASKQNRQRIAAQPPRQRTPPARPGADVRQRAIQFSKTGVPRPGSLKARSIACEAGLEQHSASHGAASTSTASAAAAAVAAADLAAGQSEAGAVLPQVDAAAEPFEVEPSVRQLGQQLAGLVMWSGEAVEEWGDQ